MVDRFVTRLAVLVVVAFAAGRAQGQGAPEPRWGTLRGRVVLEGRIPEPVVVVDPGQTFPARDDVGVCIPGAAPLRIPDYEVVAKRGGPILYERLLVDRETRGVRNAVVALVRPTAVKASAREAATRPVEFRADRGVFVPHVLAFQRGAQVMVSTDDPIAYGLYAGLSGSLRDTSVTVSAPGEADGRVLSARSQGVMNFRFRGLKANPPGGPAGVDVALDPLPRDFPTSIYVLDHEHPWMTAWWVVVDHPYFAVTDETGRFTIRDVPVGPQKVVAWHEAKGQSVPGGSEPVDRAEVNVLDGRPTEQDFVVKLGDLVKLDPSKP